MHKIALLLTLFFPLLLSGQAILSLEDAVGFALEKNYGIQIARLEQTAAETQVYRANAGMGPVIDWNANFNAGVNNANQTFLDGRNVSRFGRNWAPNTNISLGWTLYDGGRMQATYEKLGALSEYSTLQGKVLIQNTVAQVMEAYYLVVLQKERLEYLNTVIKYYEERLKITEERWQVGQGSKLDFLQSKTDLNAQLSALTTASNDLKNAKVFLNSLLNRDANTEFEVAEQMVNDNIYDINNLVELAKVKNRDLVLLDKAINISSITEQEVEAAKRPQVNFNSALGYSYTNSNTGFLLSNRNVALSAGFSARWNLYNGNHTRKQIDLARINTTIVNKQREELLNQIIADLTIAYNQYISDQELLDFEEENKVLAEENLSISLEKFKLGASSILELNEAQRAFDTALNRLVNAQFNVRIAELELLRLSGSLVN